MNIQSKQAKNQAALGLLGKTPSSLQSILPLQVQSCKYFCFYGEDRTDDLLQKTLGKFYRKDG